MLKRHRPIPDLGAHQDRATCENDAIAAVIVGTLLIPQPLACARLAGPPPEVGLCASIPSLVPYGTLGPSHALVAGPVAVVSLMTAVAVGTVAARGTPES